MSKITRELSNGGADGVKKLVQEKDASGKLNIATVNSAAGTKPRTDSRTVSCPRGSPVLFVSLNNAEQQFYGIATCLVIIK